MVEQLSEETRIHAYSGRGRSCYHPEMMLKLVLYANTQRVTSGRQMAEMCQSDIPMIRLCARQRPDFRTINRFRSERMQTFIEDVLESMVLHLMQHGYADVYSCFLDRTKIEAIVNKYSFVRKKAVEKNRAKLQSRIRDVLNEAQGAVDEEGNPVEELENLASLAQEIIRSVETGASSRETVE